MGRKQCVGGIVGAIVLATVLFAPTGPAAAEQGALAYSPSTDEVSVVSMNIFSLREVQIKALEGCSADDCRIVLTFRPGECAAVASSDKRYGTGLGPTQVEADAAAMANCSDGDQDPNCRVFGQMCAEE